jgi:hypothetical protein
MITVLAMINIVCVAMRFQEKRGTYLETLFHHFRMPDRVPGQMGPQLGIPEHGAVECETRHGNMKSLELVAFPTCMPPHNLVLFTYGAFQHDGVTAVRDHWNRPCAEPPNH